MKTACIIQGNIRKNAKIVRDEMLKHFDVVIISTWEGEESNIDAVDRCYLLFNRKPLVPGFSHRNFQRFSTAQGLRKARELNCDYVLKWRTDMLPLSFDVNSLVVKANFNVPADFASRIVTCSFRCLTVTEDFLSSIPDLFAFGHIDEMELLWGDEGIDYSKSFNIPDRFNDTTHLQGKNIEGFYCAETELYAILKNRLEIVLKTSLDHEFILKNYFYLFDQRDLDIIWFSENGYRAILQLYYPWWTPGNWKGIVKVKSIGPGYPSSKIWNFLANYVVYILTLKSKYMQSFKFKYLYKG